MGATCDITTRVLLVLLALDFVLLAEGARDGVRLDFCLFLYSFTWYRHLSLSPCPINNRCPFQESRFDHFQIPHLTTSKSTSVFSLLKFRASHCVSHVHMQVSLPLRLDDCCQLVERLDPCEWRGEF
eukprot:519102-Rhodomonas_salina.3